MKYTKALIVSIVIIVVTMLVRLPVVLYFGYSLWQYALGWLLSIVFTALVWGEVFISIKVAQLIYKESYFYYKTLTYWGHLIVITIVGVLLFFNYIGAENAILLYLGIGALSSMVIGFAVSQDI